MRKIVLKAEMRVEAPQGEDSFIKSFRDAFSGSFTGLTNQIQRDRSPTGRHVPVCLLRMDAAHMPLQVGVGCECFGTSARAATERPLAAMRELVPAQVIHAAERLPAALVAAHVRLHASMRAHVRV